MSEKINVRGIKFDNVTVDEAVNMMLENCRENRQTAVFTPNSEIVQMCVDSPKMYDVINKADITLPDGIGVIKAAKILGTPMKGRTPGFETGEELIRRSSEYGLKIFFMGGKPGVAEQAQEKLLEKYPNTKFVGFHDGYFKKDGEENDKVVNEIIKSGANVLFVCFGAPAQEQWINDNRRKLPEVKLLLGLGGSLDGYSGNLKRAPQFFCNHGLEWFYRLMCQPSRIGRMMKLPKFYFGTWRYRLQSK